MTRIAICGAAGRMGRTLLEVCRDTDGVTLGDPVPDPGGTPGQ